MHWEESLLALFEDLEQQAEGLHLVERDAEVAERTRAEYARVDFLSRVHASLDGSVVLGVEGVGDVEGVLVRAGSDWCLVESPGGQSWVVRLAAVTRARGLSGQALGESARSPVPRLGLGSVLRGVADSRSPVLLHLCDASRLRARLGRVGADFVEVVPAYADGGGAGVAASVEVMPFRRLAAVRLL
jgi:hypothetical protein